MARWLLRTKRTKQITLDVKPWPYFVSDATEADVTELVNGDGPKELCADLRALLDDGLLLCEASPEYTRPDQFRYSPGLLARWATADLVILKGDLNYRRLVGDLEWDPMTPFQEAVDYLPTKSVALRALKSELVVGLSEAVVEEARSNSDSWRVDGSRGLVQTNW